LDSSELFPETLALDFNEPHPQSEPQPVFFFKKTR